MTKEVKMVLEVPENRNVLKHLVKLRMKQLSIIKDSGVSPQERQTAVHLAAIIGVLLVRRAEVYLELRSVCARSHSFDPVVFLNAWVAVQRELSPAA